MSSSDIRDGLVYKGCTNCVQHHVIIDLKSILCWFLNIAYGVSLAIGSIRELYVSTLCLDVMLISMLINDFVFICMLLIYMSFEALSPPPWCVREIKYNYEPRSTFSNKKIFYTSFFAILFSIIIKFKDTKISHLFLLLIKLGFVLLTYNECLTNTLSWGIKLLFA
jgi:hypothetical protein